MVTAAGGEFVPVPWPPSWKVERGTLVLMIVCFLLDGYVRIWSTEAIYNTSSTESAGKPKQLASMSNHSGTIHTVRFSPNGRYLASGADDKIVCIYALDTNPPSHASTFGMFSSVYVVVGR